MAALRFRDGLTHHAWLRGLVACAVAVLALAVTVHHSGWMPDMDHGAPASPGQVHHQPMAMGGHSGHEMLVSGSPAPAPAPPADGQDPGHAMTMAMCLAILGAALLLPAIRWIRRTVRRRRTSARLRPRVTRRPPVVLLPRTWAPPPRGGPSAQSLLCVVRR